MTVELRGAHLHIDCFSGISGDMMLGALIDLGVPESLVVDAVAALRLPDIALRSTVVRRSGMVGRKVDVMHRGVAITDAHGPVLLPHTHGTGHHDHGHHDHGHDHDAHHHTHRPYAEIRALIEARCAPLTARIACDILGRIGVVEAARHGVPLAEVVFHELGAADSIADIVGVAAAMAWLAPKSVSSRTVPLGGGTVQTAHGRLPVPAPATLELLYGCEVEAGGTTELTTPTGAAIIAALVGETRAFGSMPEGRVISAGWGAGSKDFADRPNLLRLVVLESQAQRADDIDDEVELLEANVDDMTGELAAPLVEALLAAGALDAWLQPIIMKKGRPALLVSALVKPPLRVAVEAALFRESTTFGVRRSKWARTVLAREVIEVPTELGIVSVKVGGRRAPDGRVVEISTATPELEDCRRLAAAQGLPLRKVYDLANVAAIALVGRSAEKLIRSSVP